MLKKIFVRYVFWYRYNGEKNIRTPCSEQPFRTLFEHLYENLYRHLLRNRVDSSAAELCGCCVVASKGVFVKVFVKVFS